MPLLKFANAKIASVLTADHAAEAEKEVRRFRARTAAKLVLDLDHNIYIHNESVHSEEIHGPNDNGDGFPSEELQTRFQTFIGSRSTFDHKGNRIIGSVKDSMYIPLVSSASVPAGDLVENIIEVEIEKAERLIPGSIKKIEEGIITDTSMGAVVQFTVCSVCGHKAEDEAFFCEHIRGGKNRSVTAADGSTKKVWESCHGVTFFEDAVIVPLEHGGQAGGAGADSKAKAKDIIIASRDQIINELVVFATKLPPLLRREFEVLLEKLTG